MKKYCLFLFILLTVSCDKPNQFTSVEGYVTDYYSNEPIAGISLEISEIKPFDVINSYFKTNTVISNEVGYYYYEFYNKENRWYEIKSFPTEKYFNIGSRTISEGKTNTMNFALKPFKNLTLNCYNKTKYFNKLYIYTYSYPKDNDSECNPCEELAVFNFKIVPEMRNEFHIQLAHLNKANKTDSLKREDLYLHIGKNDTTINYYY
jgi:hypothetical protein